jgi:uncharacterized protein YgbK (DUF1537 family)
MILVIADDFTGAAEVAGTAWRYGLKTVLQRNMDLSIAVDALIIDTDSRSMSEAEAIKTTAIISKKINESKIDRIFKKVDSVLRGHIIAELDSMITELNHDQILMIANNPSVGRIIRQRRYYVNEREIHKTDFKHDPQFPVQSSEVSDILGKSKTVPVKFLQKSEEMKGKGIFIPEIVTKEDIIQRASTVKDDTLVAGGSDFFEVLLEVRDLKSLNKSQMDFQESQKSLIVMASTTDISRKTVLNFLNNGVAVCNLPCQKLISSNLTDHCLNQWINDISGAFKKNNTVISAIDHPVNKEPGFPDKLNHFIANMVRTVLRKISVKNLLVEGGATVSCIIKTMGWNKFQPLYEYSKAVIRLKIEEEPGCTLIVKPGSYPWPEEIFKLINS